MCLDRRTTSRVPIIETPEVVLFSGDQTLNMKQTLSITQFAAIIHERQSELIDSLEKPILTPLAILTLSRPVCEMNGQLILEFFGVFWLPDDLTAGFFNDQCEVEAHIAKIGLDARV